MLMSELPVVSVRIPPELRSYANGHEEVMASGETVGDILEAVAHSYPALGHQLFCRDGELADGLCVYIGGLDLHHLSGLERPVEPEELLSLVAISKPNCPMGSGGNAPMAAKREATLPEGAISIGE
jgi:sulfur-carrier protein